jgi:hypothetical protein
MKKTLITLLSAVLFLVAPVAAQTILTNTTLSAAVSSSSAKTLNLTSATGVNAPSTSDLHKADFPLRRSRIGQRAVGQRNPRQRGSRCRWNLRSSARF